MFDCVMPTRNARNGTFSPILANLISKELNLSTIMKALIMNAHAIPVVISHADI